MDAAPSDTLPLAHPRAISATWRARPGTLPSPRIALKTDYGDVTIPGSSSWTWSPSWQPRRRACPSPRRDRHPHHVGAVSFRLVRVDLIGLVPHSGRNFGGVAGRAPRVDDTPRGRWPPASSSCPVPRSRRCRYRGVRPALASVPVPVPVVPAPTSHRCGTLGRRRGSGAQALLFRLRGIDSGRRSTTAQLPGKWAADYRDTSR